eukprot:CAMPEP_0119107104 /NCGR_PEP_ID=MMETSP1180-20130426/7951_1 /TAXON_ID=3052 ORGANISM="Chlamydomonas cf sp, Strain CCMP681" /NCGR_SAMPLE_ID=MMETSP1180 /ASSEMBLY_ACC=CAM_ASM_000741 /LENGTH=390 /DNA_ID=CAMNT_0007092541 /DNA_START=35 /DNA_END=1207 /DNA_ORIENTATION=-
MAHAFAHKASQNVALPATRSVAQRASVRVMSHHSRGAATAAILMVAQLAPAARAEEVSAVQVADTVPVDSAIEAAVNVLKAGGEILKSGISSVEAGVKVLQQGYDVVEPVVAEAVRNALPVVEQVYNAVEPVVVDAFRSAAPVAQDASQALQRTGFDAQAVSDVTSTVTSTVNTAATAVSPYVNQAVQFVSTNDPVTLAEYGIGAAVLITLAPPLLGTFFGSFRGYAGELFAAAALDALMEDKDVVLIDIRSLKEKDGSGIPDLPSFASSKSLEVEYAVTEDKKLRGQLRDPSSIEAQITALQIASLKKIGKGTKVILLDRYGPAARTVAKELARKGYGRVYVIDGGFDGRGGWVQSKLQIKPASTLQSLAPPSATRSIFARKALPSPRS